MTIKPDQFLLALDTLKTMIWEFQAKYGIDPVRVHSPLWITTQLKRDPRLLQYLSFSGKGSDKAYFMGIEWIQDSEAYAVVGPSKPIIQYRNREADYAQKESRNQRSSRNHSSG